MASWRLPSLFAFLAIITLCHAHGHVHQIIVDNVVYPGPSPNWYENTTAGLPVAETPGWYAYNQDQGFVTSGWYKNHAITCHIGARPGSMVAPVNAGANVDIRWNRWLPSHQGAVLDYMARCPGACADVQSGDLEFFKIDEDGMYDGTPRGDEYPGVWATDKLSNQNFVWSTKIPANLPAGQYVLRHEIVSLHRANRPNLAESYPTCINLEVNGTGSVHPCDSGADCRRGTDLYDPSDPGVNVDIYHDLSNYTIPGPRVWPGL